MEQTPSQWHGLAASEDWPLPQCVAKSDQANRADQGNSTPANEYMDSPAVLDEKVGMLAEMLRKSRSTCAYTGAGLSKASGIPDYATKAAKSVVAGPKIRSSLEALPTYAHQCLVLLHKNGMLHNWVQQNHDGLPQKAGFPQEHVNEIHGAWFDPSNPVVQFDGSLRHDLFEWMLEQEKQTDLCLCLGTSLSGMNADRIVETPAKKAARGRALGSVIINLQKTRLDAKSSLRIWGKLDDVFKLLLEKLTITMPPGGLEAKPLPPSDIFVVPYNRNGEQDSGVKMTLNLSAGSDIMVPIKHAMNFQEKGKVLGKGRDGNYLVDIGGVRRALGTWMIDAALRGALPLLPVMNVDPVVKAVAPKAPAPPPVEIERLDVPPPPPRAPEVNLPSFIEVIQSHQVVNDSSGNQHEWSLRLPDGSEEIVQEVLWRLHPTFKNPDVKVKGAPFQIDRIGWGTFEVGVQIKLLPHVLDGKILTSSHHLKFDQEGERAAVTRINVWCDKKRSLGYLTWR